jgi:hypothetical protein
MVVTALRPAPRILGHSPSLANPSADVGFCGRGRGVTDSPSVGQPIRRQRAHPPGTFVVWNPGINQAVPNPPTAAVDNLPNVPAIPRASPSHSTKVNPINGLGPTLPNEIQRQSVLPGVENIPPFAGSCMHGGSSSSEASPVPSRPVVSQTSDFYKAFQPKHLSTQHRGPSLPVLGHMSSGNLREVQDSTSGSACSRISLSNPPARTKDVQHTPILSHRSFPPQQSSSLRAASPSRDQRPGALGLQPMLSHSSSAHPPPLPKCQQTAPIGLARLPPLSRGFNSYEVDSPSPCALDDESDVSGSLSTSASESDFEEHQQVRPLVGIGPSGIHLDEIEDFDDDLDDEGCVASVRHAAIQMPPPPAVPPLTFLPAAIFAAQFTAARQPLCLQWTSSGRQWFRGNELPRSRPASAIAKPQRREWSVDSLVACPTYAMPYESAREPAM